ncbi:NAD(P)-binding protein [Ferrovibrio xuzhouensis]|uniref:NAD(P)-binding protein n=1 Tax=Ferrovibrio xuzhouensis TaxID=1576914 RepID=A0ABV7V9Z4_9PROT
MSEQKKRKIAILGGGVGALTSAFYLASRPGAAEMYEITVYSIGWRLGGKCATGRNPEFGNRIEEHGIHGFLGSYYNTLSMMSSAYDQLGRQPGEPLATFEDAFYPIDSILCWEFRDYRWVNWKLTMPRNDLKPWEPQSLPTLRHWIEAVIGFMGRLFEHHAPSFATVGFDGSIARGMVHSMTSHAAAIARGEGGPLLTAIEDFWNWFKRQVEKLVENSDALRHLYVTLDYFLTMLRGIIKDDVINKGFDQLDGENFSDWFARHGGSMLTISSPLSMNTPNLSYQYPDGDTTRSPQMAAGAYLHWTLREFAYLGSFGWLFAAGTGDTVVAPLYLVLKRLGVKFELFHKVREITANAAGDAVDEVVIDVQATPKDATAGYDPLIDLPLAKFGGKTLPVWPDRPRYEQLAEGDRLQAADVDLESYWTSWQPVGEKRLKAGRDFDTLICGIAIGALPYLAPGLMAANPKWPQMVGAIKTVQTQTLQVWMKRSLKQMGLPFDFKNYDRLIGATFVNPIDGVADFSDLIPMETWPAANMPQSLLYFSGATPQYGPQPPFSDHDYPAREYDRVKYQAQQYLQACMGALLPKAVSNVVHPPGDPIGFDFSELVCLEDDAATLGVARLDQQFWKPNIDPTERYTTSPPGSTQYRLKAWNSGFSNLVLAGDWIYTGLNVGSFEGACMGGKLAVHAVDPTAMPLDQVYGYPPGQGPVSL